MHTGCLSNNKWSALKTHIQVTLHRLIMFYLGLAMYIHTTYMHIRTSNERRNHKFEREQGKGLGEDKEGRNDVTAL